MYVAIILRIISVSVQNSLVKAALTTAWVFLYLREMEVVLNIIASIIMIYPVKTLQGLLTGSLGFVSDAKMRALGGCFIIFLEQFKTQCTLLEIVSPTVRHGHWFDQSCDHGYAESVCHRVRPVCTHHDSFHHSRHGVRIRMTSPFISICSCRRRR